VVASRGLVGGTLIAEEIGRAVAPGPFIGVNLVGVALAASGTHQELAGRLAAGEATAAWCLGATTCGVSPPGSVRAVPKGAAWVLRGTAGPLEWPVDAVLLTANCAEGVLQVLVDPTRPGAKTFPASSIDLTHRYAAMTFDSYEVSDSDVVSGPGEAGAVVERQLGLAVSLQCAESCGVMQRALEMTVDYAFDRYSFGRPLASYQALKHRFADMRLWLESSHAATSAAVRAQRCWGEVASEAVSVAKAYIGSKGPSLLQDCVQLHGGIAVTWDHDLHLYLRRFVENMSRFGTPAEHKERIASILDKRVSA
jgi:alkylation response protein AidB-like acyl-CoA dehydrogenase